MYANDNYKLHLFENFIGSIFKIIYSVTKKLFQEEQ